MSSTHTLAFEIGTEEIPAFDLNNATKQYGPLMCDALDAMRVPHGEVSVYTTPRRMIALVADVAETTEGLDEIFRGPSAKIAFDEAGNPTKAAVGFARGKGVDVDALERREENGVEYVFATRRIEARDVAELLPGVLQNVIKGIVWPKSCRWGTTSEYFSRPVRWLVALLGDRVIPVEFAGLTGGRLTYGHRFLAPGPFELASADDLLATLRSAHVVVSEQEREEAIREGVAELERETGAHAVLPEKTLVEVINLCEQPTVLMGTFDAEFLKVPEEIIVDAMLMHQRYFPLYDAAGKLTNKFIIVSNGNPECADIIINGNERVVLARLSDAKFFYEEDLKHPLESYVEHLDEVVFQESLGTVLAKTQRMVTLAEHLADDAALTKEDTADAVRAALLCKADLVTNAVIEFTSVQGIMGSYYAAASGENEQVALAIADHYRPRFSGDDLPASQVGQIVAMADKLDTICGLFAVGQGPTGSSDPFALRRSAIGIVSMLEAGLPVSLLAAIEVALNSYERDGVKFDREEARAQIIDFFITRTRVILRDSGCESDTIDAVLACGVEEPGEIIKRVRALEAARADNPEVFEDLATAYARANNLREASLGTEVNESLIEEAERTLLDAIIRVNARVEAALEDGEYAQALEVLASLRAPIDRFFDDVLVMDENMALRRNRLRLLNKFVAVFSHVADFGKMAKVK